MNVIKGQKPLKPNLLNTQNDFSIHQNSIFLVFSPSTSCSLSSHVYHLVFTRQSLISSSFFISNRPSDWMDA